MSESEVVGREYLQRLVNKLSVETERAEAAIADARKDVEARDARIAELGALIFRIDLTQKEREERCGEITREALGRLDGAEGG